LNCLNPRSFEAIVLKAPYAKASQVKYSAQLHRRLTGDKDRKIHATRGFRARAWLELAVERFHPYLDGDRPPRGHSH
jgi:hypothetical protein